MAKIPTDSDSDSDNFERKQYSSSDSDADTPALSDVEVLEVPPAAPPRLHLVALAPTAARSLQKTSDAKETLATSEPKSRSLQRPAWWLSELR